MIAHLYTRPRSGSTKLRVVSAEDARREPLSIDSCDLIWVDVDSPGPEDIEWLRRSFSFHRLALEDVERRHQRAKIDEYPGYYFCVLYAARTLLQQRQIDTYELQFFWGANYLVTIHTDACPEVEDLSARARSGALTSVVGAEDHPPTIADLVYRLIDSVVDGYFPAADALAEWTEDIEDTMFGPRRRARDTLQQIFRLRKDLIELRKAIAPSREVVNVMLRRDNALFGNEFLPFFQDVYDHTVRILDTLDTNRDVLSTALDTHLSVVSNDVSQTVKTMTAVTAILMVNALIAGIYGMNFEFMPELHWQYGYPFSLGLMAAISFALWTVLKRIGWL